MANPATTLARTTQDERIPGLPVLPAGTDPNTLTVPVYNPATDKTHQAPLGGPPTATNATIGGVKVVRYTDSKYFGVPAQALTLDRLDPATITPGTLAVVANPSKTPTTATDPPQQYVATEVAVGTVGSVLVPRYLGAAAGDTVPIIWKVVNDNSTPPATYTATENVGGVHSGDSFTTADQAVVQMLITYQAPAFTSFLLDNGGTRTILAGTSFAAGFKSVTWAIRNSANVVANSLILEDLTAGTTLASGEANDGFLSASTAAFTATVGSPQVYRLRGLDTKGNGFMEYVSISGETQSYLGLSTATSLSGPQAVALGGAQIQGSRARTASGITANAGDYLYYAYDARHGDLTSIVLDGAAPVLGAFQKLGDVASTNAAGAAVTLRVYRSNAPNAFSSNSLAFS